MATTCSPPRFLYCNRMHLYSISLVVMTEFRPWKPLWDNTCALPRMRVSVRKTLLAVHRAIPSIQRNPLAIPVATSELFANDEPSIAVKTIE